MLVKQPLGSGKSFQARKLATKFEYSRVLWLTSTRALAQETCRLTGFTNYQHVPHCTPLCYIEKLVVLIPSLYRLYYDFIPYDCIIMDESESIFQDFFSGLCKGPHFELMLAVFTKLMTTARKVVLMDGFMKNSSLSICANFCRKLDDIRLIIGTYRINRGTL